MTLNSEGCQSRGSATCAQRRLGRWIFHKIDFSSRREQTAGTLFPHMWPATCMRRREALCTRSRARRMFTWRTHTRLNLMFDWTILTRPRHDCQFNGLTRLNLFALVASRLMTLPTPHHINDNCPAYRHEHFSLSSIWSFRRFFTITSARSVFDWQPTPLMNSLCAWHYGRWKFVSHIM